MEAAATCSVNLSGDRALFVYAGIAGEPALGPPAFMHRFSGIDNPEAPLSHHWLDSTHVTYGVVTAGYVWDRVKLEASSFNGREPDQYRYDVELRGLDSYSARLSFNPLRISRCKSVRGGSRVPSSFSPRSPNTAVPRRRASTGCARAFNGRRPLHSAAMIRSPEPRATHGCSNRRWYRRRHHTGFARAERVAKDELFLPGQPLYGRTFTVNSLSLGYIYDFAHLGPRESASAACSAVYRYPSVLDESELRRLAALRIWCSCGCGSSCSAVTGV
jgi:hypothetical protein